MNESCMARTRERDEVLDSTLRFIARQGWLETGKPFLDSLVEFLGTTLGVAYVLVDELLPSGDRARTLALYSNGEPAHNIEYDLRTTPCENVMNKRLCVYPEGLRSLFPDDELLVQMNAESYIGIPLWDSKGAPVGLIAVMDTRPLRNVEIMREVVQTVALRTAHELEWRRDRERLAEYYANLEATVVERTAELMLANEMLKEANAEIASINDKLKTMTGMVTHDIANQVLVINGSIALMEAQGLDEGTRRSMERIRHSLEIISKSVEVAREYRAKGTAPVWHDMMSILDNLGSPKLYIDPCLKGLSIFADPMLEKAFFNLLDNSDKHGGRVTGIKVSCCRGTDPLKIVWEDDGVGVPEQEKSMLFEHMVGDGRVHGLALIKKILGQTGIMIEENGEPGKGARFEIVVPTGAFLFTSE